MGGSSADIAQQLGDGRAVLAVQESREPWRVRELAVRRRQRRRRRRRRRRCEWVGGAGADRTVGGGGEGSRVEYGDSRPITTRPVRHDSAPTRIGAWSGSCSGSGSGSRRHDTGTGGRPAPGHRSFTTARDGRDGQRHPTEALPAQRPSTPWRRRTGRV